MFYKIERLVHLVLVLIGICVKASEYGTNERPSVSKGFIGKDHEIRALPLKPCVNDDHLSQDEDLLTR